MFVDKGGDPGMFEAGARGDKKRGWGGGLDTKQFFVRIHSKFVQGALGAG